MYGNIASCFEMNICDATILTARYNDFTFFTGRFIRVLDLKLCVSRTDE